MRKLTIAIDGHASTGKSSIARGLALKYGYIYINSGSMYRAVTLFALENNLLELLDQNIDLFIEKLKNISINFKFNKNNLISEIFINDRNIEKEIGSLKVSNLVSRVAAIPKIRREMVKLQRNIDRNKGVVMDGRDIGSVVFPNADIKFWVTASAEKRAYRRWLEFKQKGQNIAIEKVIENINYRDKNDENREESPLVKPKNSIEIDSTNINAKETFQYALDIIKKHLKKFKKQ